MKLISLNVAMFEDNNHKLFKFLINQNPDIACFQEVTDWEDSTVYPKFISKDTIDKATSDLKYSYFVHNWIIKDFSKKNFHKKANFIFEFGGFLKYGNYIKSKYKILKKQNIFLTKNSIKVTDWSTWPEKQTKSVQVVDLELVNNKKLRIVNYHGIWTKEKIGNELTLKACKKIYELATQVNFPVIITGDFNLLPDTESIKIFADKFISLVDKYNIKTTRPGSNELNHLKRNVVDYIFISPQIKVNNFEVLNTDISDHLPLVLEFDILKP